MSLAQPERVGGLHLGAAMSRPGRAALSPAAPVAGAAGVPVGLVGEPAAPAAQAGVVAGDGGDLVYQPA